MEVHITAERAVLVVEIETPTPHWAVRREDSLAPMSLHKTFQEAVVRANAMAAKLGVEIMVRRREGEASLA